MENLIQYTLNKRFAENTGNRVDPSAEQFSNGIERKSEARSNTLNGYFYLLSQAIQYLQFTGGLYDNNASYNEGNIVSCVVKDIDKYRLWKFRRNSNNASILTGNAPITGSVETVNGVDVYVLGTVSEDWDKLEDFNYSSEATPNFIISRDNEGSAKVEMPSVVDDKSIVNKEYLKAENTFYNDDKSLGATNVQNAIGKVVDKIDSVKYSSEAIANNVIIRDSSGSAKVKMPSNVVNDTIVNKSYLQASNILSTGDWNDVQSFLDVLNASIQSINILIEDLKKRLTIPPYYIQFANASGVFESSEAPDTWYQNKFVVSTTWQLMFNTDSVAFITEGSYSNSGRSGGIQGDAIRNITGYNVSFASIFGRSSSGVIYSDETLSQGIQFGVSGEYNRININASRQVPTASVNRMRNRLIRVYRLLSINGVSVR